MKSCAYCGRSCKPTREHLFPSSFHALLPDLQFNFSGVTKKVFGGEYQIKDVCRPCNNGPLSALDTYAKELFTRYFGRFVEADETVAFEYDLHRLQRWLLKVSYNTARTDRDAAYTELFEQFRPYILTGESPPTNVLLYLWLIKPTTAGGHTVFPEPLRSCRFMMKGNGFDNCLSWHVTLRSYGFLVSIQPDGYAEPDLLEYVATVSRVLPGVVLRPDANAVTVTTSHVDTHAVYLAHIVKYLQTYLPHLDEAKVREILMMPPEE